MSAASSDMAALVLHAVGDLRLERVPRPDCGPGEALVRVASCGVCGSDIPRVYAKGTYSFPRIPGHEFAGTIERVGPGHSGFEPGDRVAVFPLIWCGKCRACERGGYVQCAAYDYLGSRSDGAFAEHVVAPLRNLIRVPDGVSLEAAAMTEPAAVALHALRRAGGASIGQTVAVFGAGPIGLIVAQWARSMGAAAVLVFDVVEEKLDLARRVGVDRAFDSRRVDPVKTVLDLTAGEGAHVTVEAAGVPATTLQALDATRRGGHAVLLGNPSADVLLPAALISRAMRREIDIHGTWNSDYSPAGNDDDWRAALDAMASGRLSLEPLVSHRPTLSEARGVLERMRDRSGFFSKVLIRPASD